MVNLPGPVDEIIGLAALQTLIDSPGLVRGVTSYLGSVGGSLSAGMKRIGYERFARFWIPYRLLVSLQLRLFVETVAFSMGKPWSNLVSGFKPLRMRLRGLVGEVC